jgi:hypothetical protein
VGSKRRLEASPGVEQAIQGIRDLQVDEVGLTRERVNLVTGAAARLGFHQPREGPEPLSVDHLLAEHGHGGLA